MKDEVNRDVCSSIFNVNPKIYRKHRNKGIGCCNTTLPDVSSDVDQNIDTGSVARKRAMTDVHLGQIAAVL